ncbi:hypothetical protein E2C01_001005 [Portunus trituberculatus]|uniref:Uncharacterized protein n=1 Tax=Portunus trituberculatus TaxID=210409 RepID=A0A5B7CGL3_PORTR|nr:hypothetical protein [Portunus trituberculatus]
MTQGQGQDKPLEKYATWQLKANSWAVHQLFSRCSFTRVQEEGSGGWGEELGRDAGRLYKLPLCPAVKVDEVTLLARHIPSSYSDSSLPCHGASTSSVAISLS